MIAFTIPLLISLMLVRSEEIAYVSQPIGGWINYTSVQMNPAENNTYLIVIDNNTTLFTLDVFFCESLNVTENSTICTVEMNPFFDLGLSRTVPHHWDFAAGVPWDWRWAEQQVTYGELRSGVDIQIHRRANRDKGIWYSDFLSLQVRNRGVRMMKQEYSYYEQWRITVILQ